MATDMTNAVTGALMGAAVGDALGSCVDGAKAGMIKNACRTLSDYIDPAEIFGREKSFKWRKPGLYTSITQQAMAVSESLVGDRGVRPEKTAARFLSLCGNSESPYGIFRMPDRNLRAALDALREGLPWDRAGSEYPGAGAAARIAPVALHLIERESALPDAVMRLSLITHRSVPAVSAAAAVAQMVMRLAAVAPDDFTAKAELIRETAAFCVKIETALCESHTASLPSYARREKYYFSDMLMGLADQLGREPAQVEKWIVESSAKNAPEPVARPTHEVACASVVYAIYNALVYSHDFEKAVTVTLNAGGFASAACAITGAIAGALHGAEAIPERWLAGLANRRQVALRAEAFARGRIAGPGAEKFIDMESALTKRENDERTSRMKKSGVELKPKKNREDQFEKLSRPVPVTGKYDGKTYRRDLKKIRKNMPED